MTKAITPERHYRAYELSIDDERWNGLKQHLPDTLTAEADARLRSGILECCSWFLTENDRANEARGTFASMRKLKQFATSLRQAADTWADIKDNIHNDRVTDISRFDVLDSLAADAERRLAALEAIKPRSAVSPWDEFVRRVARCCIAARLKPGVTGRLYDDAQAKPTWFQKFIVALNRDLLGSKGPRQSASDNAEAATITKAMRGYKK